MTQDLKFRWLKTTVSGGESQSSGFNLQESQGVLKVDLHGEAADSILVFTQACTRHANKKARSSKILKDAFGGTCTVPLEPGELGAHKFQVPSLLQVAF